MEVSASPKARRDVRAKAKRKKTQGVEAQRLHVAAECVVCLDSAPTVQLLECNHVCLCEDCSPLVVHTCPLCRASITDRQQLRLKDLAQSPKMSWEELVGTGFIRMCLCNKTFVRLVLIAFQLAEEYVMILPMIQFSFAFIPLYQGYKKGFSTREADYLPTNFMWTLAAVITACRFFWLPKIRRFQIKYMEPPIRTEFHVSFKGRGFQVITWQTLVTHAKKMLLAYLIQQATDWIWPLYVAVTTWQSGVPLRELIPAFIHTWWWRDDFYSKPSSSRCG